jgi:FkbM family methyltransferase
MKTVKRRGISFQVHADTENAGFWEIADWEAENYATVERFSGRCSTFVNAGGWIGPFTLFAAKLYRRVYSLEPDPAAFAELSRNVAANGFTNVHLQNRAFYKESGTISIGSDYSPIGRSGTSIFQQQNAVVVPCETLRTFFDRHDIRDAFLMLDVEGAEWALFDDTAFFVERKPILLVEFHLDLMDQGKRKHLAEALDRLQPLYGVGVKKLPARGIVHELFVSAA